MKNTIRQALAYHATKDPVKGVKIPKDVKFHFPVEYATSNNKQM